MIEQETNTVKTSLKADSKFKLELKYRICNQDQKVHAKAKTALVFAERSSGKLIPGFKKYLEPMSLKMNYKSSVS